MTDDNRRREGGNQRGLNNDSLDRQLDAALARLATVEPRAGLEARVLANLQAERERAAEHSWWRLPAVAALAALIVVALSLAWRSGHSTQNTAAQHPPASMQSNEQDGTQFANHAGSGSIPPHQTVFPGKRKPRAVFHPATAAASAPKLDHFPSPQPLSEQERMLTEYVAQHHLQAVLIARARMVELKDLAEEMEASPTSNRQTSDQSVSRQEDR